MKRKNKWLNAQVVKEMRNYFLDNEIEEILNSVNPRLAERYSYAS